MHLDRQLTEDRITRLLRDRIRPAALGERIPCDIAVWHAPGEPVPAAEALAAGYAPFTAGSRWGRPWGTSWFHLTGRVPEHLSGRRIDLVVDLGFRPEQAPGFQAEGLFHAASGEPLKGLHPRNDRLRVDGSSVDVYLEAASNPNIFQRGAFLPTELGDLATAGAEPLYRFEAADLAVVNEDVEALRYDIEVLDGVMRELSTEDPRRHEILHALDRMASLLDPQDIAASAAEARTVLAPVLEAKATRSAHRLSAVGHAHIDSAWLWPLRETVRKCARTFLNVISLCDEYPDLVFACSQAQQYAWMKEHYPSVYARLRQKVESGQFVPVGGMWVESDTNLPGGEALVRQFTHGKRFFLDEFGIECSEVWLPDSFGYSAALPQIARLAGCESFLSQKLSWNQTNAFPHHTFRWEGLDGTSIFTHFPPVDTYVGLMNPAQHAHASRNFAEKGRATRSLVPFGYGDGGGGPTRGMMERARRLSDLEGTPRVTIERPAAFFRAARDEYPQPPVWVGEMYLELHRATYTTQALMKQGNRRSEHLLREAELWSATAATTLSTFEYPYGELDRIWKTVLLHQFHDILPGSSIAWVHREAAETYRRLAGDLTGLIDRAQRALAGEGTTAIRFNAAPQARAGVPALSAAATAAPSADSSYLRETADGWTLDNGLLRVDIDRSGVIYGIRDDVAGRDVLPRGGRANLLQLHQDTPVRWDAWDVDRFYRDSVTDLTVAERIKPIQLDDGRAAVEISRSFGASTAVQTISLRPGARQVDFTTTVDWHETEKFLKVAFPLAIRADVSTSEIQFGHVHRPTHTNTSWEAARFEICAHRWIHVGEPGYGTAIANDSTYGHDVTRYVDSDGETVTTVRLSLLRAPRFPDPATDQGTHTVGYSLLCGAGVGDAIAAGLDLNLPVRTVPGSREVAPLVTVDNPAVVVEAVKLADDRSGDVVVRLYESLGGRAGVTVSAGFPVSRVSLVDLLERYLDEAPAVLTLRPFQIVTLRFTPER